MQQVFTGPDMSCKQAVIVGAFKDTRESENLAEDSTDERLVCPLCSILQVSVRQCPWADQPWVFKEQLLTALQQVF